MRSMRGGGGGGGGGRRIIPAHYQRERSMTTDLGRGDNEIHSL